MPTTTVNRSYKLPVYGNRDKVDTARYQIAKFKEYINIYVGKLYFNGNKSTSTDGLGYLANWAQYRARSIIKALRAAEKETGSKTNVPVVKNVGAPAKLEKSKLKTWDYFVSVSNQFTKRGVVKLPAKSTKVLNAALKDGWKLTNSCEIKEIKGRLFVMVFVEKEVERANPEQEVLGVDAGYKHACATSDGYLGNKIGKVIKKRKASTAERYRQRTKYNQVQKLYKDKRSEIKQLIDKEAKYLIGRSKKTSRSLSIESSKALSNLRSGNLQGWARCYLSARLKVLCRENSVYVLDVNPAYSSMTCAKCLTVDAKSRHRQKFNCINCGSYDHADVNAAKVLALRGQRAIREKIIPKLRSDR